MPEHAAKPEQLGGYATIKAGQYDTRIEGRGHLGGKVKAIIHGYDGIAQVEMSQGSPLFPSLELPLELPSEHSTRDFLLP